MRIQFLKSSCQQGQSSPGVTGHPVHRVTNWLQIQELEAVQLPLVERQSTAKKCLTHLLCGIAQDVKARLSRKCATKRIISISQPSPWMLFRERGLYGLYSSGLSSSTKSSQEESQLFSQTYHTPTTQPGQVMHNLCPGYALNPSLNLYLNIWTMSLIHS